MNEHKCLACGGTKFSTRNVLLSTTGLTFIGMDWMNPSAAAYICEKCGYIMFYSQVSPKQEENHDDPHMLEEEHKRAIEWFDNRA